MESDLQSILEQIEIEDILDREGVEYKHATGSSGPQLWVRECPACGNSSWKVYLNRESGLGNCFAGSCEAKFNKWTFAQTLLNLSAKETYTYLSRIAEELGWRPRARKGRTEKVRPQRVDLYLPKSFKIPIGGKNLSFLAHRGIDAMTAAHFDLRYSQGGQFAYANSEGDMRVQDYSKRVIIPVYTERGELVSFQGRDVTGSNEPKYQNPPGYCLRDYFYNEWHLTGDVRRLVVCEGAFDVFSVHQALNRQSDFRDTLPVATMGKALSAAQTNRLRELKARGLGEVIMMWDGEIAAMLDALKTALLMLKLGLTARLCMMPIGRDPNEMAADEVCATIRSAQVVDRLQAARLHLTLKSTYPAK